ncbi:NUC173 domain-containing protein [Scheffersomyces coipomensis]|uniref:NUC173 domain-containing protein n=1 Tax=Scheffersomyces coipomensis TaxID=1788519 RepID=UPI00315CB521
MSDLNPDGGLSSDFFALDDRLAKIRAQITSKLENQKHLAVILSAVEENIEEQKNEKTPVAYFVSFLSLLNQSINDNGIVDAKLAATTAYFLDIVLPFTPKPLLKSKFGEILTKLAPSLTHADSEAALIRSSIGALESLLLAQDYQQWQSSGNISPKRAFVGLLELSFDPRPKVRRRAQESVNKILSNPPASPSPSHAVSILAAEISLAKLTSLVGQSKKNKSSSKELNSQIIHCLQLISSIASANSWPNTQIEALCDVLLDISKTSDQYLVSSAFSAFEALFNSMTDFIYSEKFASVLNIIFDLKPSVNDTHLAASWLAVVAKALECYGRASPEDAIRRIPTYVPIISQFLSSESKDIYSSASQCLIAIVSQVIPDKYLLEPSKELNVTEDIYDLVDETITFLSEFIEKELLSIRFQFATKDILEFITAAILKLRSRCNPDFLGIVGVVGEWRTNETDQFPYNTEAENLIAASITTMGPEVVLSVLPLNLTNGDSQGRAWLLPLLRDNVRFTELEYYKKSILQVAEFFQNKIIESANKESLNAKVFQTIIDQIWSLLPHFCDLPKDLITAFDDSYAAQLSDLMYSKVELRVPICHALRLLVESNLAYRDGALEDDLLSLQQFSIAQAEINVKYLSAKASNILSVLFNVFSSTLPDARGFVLETIDSYLQVMSNEDLESTFNKVCGLLKSSMDQEAEQTKAPKGAKLTITMMDLVVAMAKYVPSTSYNALFTIFSGVVSHQDALMQKRAYRIISKLCETESGKESVKGFMQEIEKVFIETTEGTHSSARASRLNAILEILELIPETDLYFIPATLQEIIISTKDVNERTRELSYAILIKMGNIMINGGIIENSKVPGFGEDAPPSEANLTEYITMVSAGLAAQAPHMISATITAISCLVFEFKDKLPTDVLLEIASTVELFLTHNSREIAKSAIGFVKVEVLSLPEELVKANLSELLEKLMKWSHEHKGHFKSKVKHILERLIRKFGIEEIENAIPEDDKKLIVNIRKSRNRAKRKQQEEAEEEGKSGATGEKKFVSAYEEAVYDSDSDDDEDDEADQGKGGKKAPSQFILENGEDPLNLLDRQTLAHISSSKPSKFSKKDVKQSQFKTKNGKLVFNESNDNEEDPLANKGPGIDAYLEAVKQAPIRGQKNKLKYNKKNRQEDNWSDDDEPEAPKPKPSSNALGKARIAKPKQKFKARKKF